MATMKEFLRKISTNPVTREMIPLGFGYGLPIVSTTKGEIVIRIPFFREEFRANDKTLVFPVQYVVSALWKNGQIIEARDLSYVPVFRKVQMHRPVGTFRHPAVAHMNKKEYFQEKHALYLGYDKLLAAMKAGEELSEEDKNTFIKKLNTIIEPSLKPFYYAIDQNFAETYIEKGVKRA